MGRSHVLTPAAVLRENRHFWRGIEGVRRARIRRAVWRGEPVADPRDAELAVRWARLVQQRADAWPPRPLAAIHGALLALALVGTLLVGTAPVVPLLLGGYLAAHLLGLKLVLRAVGKRAARAERMNIHRVGIADGY
jgi:hypothetical protein